MSFVTLSASGTRRAD